MEPRCGCGREVHYAFHHLACIECGAACCPGCSVGLESVTYCRRCAGSLLEATRVSPGHTFDLQ
ncbi:MAG: hypothetical protein ACREF4_05855 [Gammaproteobacteria bacterium]